MIMVHTYNTANLRVSFLPLVNLVQETLEDLPLQAVLGTLYRAEGRSLLAESLRRLG